MRAFRAFYTHQNHQELPLSKLALSWASLVSASFSKKLSLILRRHIHVEFHNLGRARIDGPQKIIEISSHIAPIDFYLGISKEVLPYITHYFFGGIERNYKKLSNRSSFSETFILENFAKIFTSSLNESFKSLNRDLDLNYSYQSDAEFTTPYQNEESFELFTFSFEDHGELFELNLYLPLSFFSKLSLV